MAYQGWEGDSGDTTINNNAPEGGAPVKFYVINDFGKCFIDTRAAPSMWLGVEPLTYVRAKESRGPISNATHQPPVIIRLPQKKQPDLKPDVAVGQVNFGDGFYPFYHHQPGFL